MLNEQNDIWIDMEIQPTIIASMIRQYNRFKEADSYQIEHETMSFKDFVNQIIVEGRKPFLKAGDSGSLLVTQSCNSPTGLLFAGNGNGKMAVANHIDAVLEAFAVSVDGE